jgi:hypothetical protein
VEWDTGTEDLGRLVGKLVGYEQAAHHGPRYPVLFCLHSPTGNATSTGRWPPATTRSRSPPPCTPCPTRPAPCGPSWATQQAPGGG